MTVCLGGDCSFGLLCESFGTFIKCMCVFLSLSVLREGCGI